MIRPPGTQVDHYELLDHLGDGAQAEVHRAKDLWSGQEVVIRFPHRRVLDHPVLAARWRREAHLTEALCHPHLHAGQVPHTGPDPWAAMSSHLDQDPVPLRDRRADVPPALEAVVLTALRRHPEHRYPSAPALLDDLERLDRVDPADYDLGPEAPMAGPIGGSEGLALLRLGLAVAGGFLGVVALVILLSIVLR